MDWIGSFSNYDWFSKFNFFYFCLFSLYFFFIGLELCQTLTGFQNLIFFIFAFFLSIFFYLDWNLIFFIFAFFLSIFFYLDRIFILFYLSYFILHSSSFLSPFAPQRLRSNGSRRVSRVNRALCARKPGKFYA